MSIEQEWPLFEVFIRARSGLEHKHVGSIHAADEKMAIEHARDVYTRRMEGVSIWASDTGNPAPRRRAACMAGGCRTRRRARR